MESVMEWTKEQLLLEARAIREEADRMLHQLALYSEDVQREVDDMLNDAEDLEQRAEDYE